MPRVCTSQPAKAELQVPWSAALGSTTAGNRATAGPHCLPTEHLGCSQRQPPSSALGRGRDPLHLGLSAGRPDLSLARESEAGGTADSGPTCSSPPPTGHTAAPRHTGPPLTHLLE